MFWEVLLGVGIADEGRKTYLGEQKVDMPKNIELLRARGNWRKNRKRLVV